MNTSIGFKSKISKNDDLIFLMQKSDDLKNLNLNDDEILKATSALKNKEDFYILHQKSRYIFLVIVDNINENARKIAYKIHSLINFKKIESVTVLNTPKTLGVISSFCEGLALSNYQFLKYFTKKKKHSLCKIYINDTNAKNKVKDLQAVIEGVFIARNFVNEPLSYLNATQYSSDIKKIGKKYNLLVTTYNKEKIEKLKMGGLLAVNKGSIDPPTFNIIKWQPKKAINKNPIILVGKGIVYDTGGLSLKPTQNSMDLMKSDMAGSAAVFGAILSIAKIELNLNVIALIPATDNRPSQNAYAPGDVIKMHNSSTVEVLNTDAEGRLILADALSFAKKFNPEFVIDVATLTGSAARTIGKQGIVAMGNDFKTMEKLKKSGQNVYERLAELPFWDEYKDDLKSNIADLKNLGGPEAGAITAGKFLESFTSYPYTHLDIAGAAFMTQKFNYRGVGGTGVGVRLLFDFLKTLCHERKN
mgnify:FL=1